MACWNAQAGRETRRSLFHMYCCRSPFLPTLVLGWGESSQPLLSALRTQAAAYALSSLETASLPQQLLMSLHHSPNSPATFLFSCFTSSTEDWSTGAALQAEAVDRIVSIKKQTVKNICFSPTEVAVKHLLFLERLRLYRSLA